VVPPHLHRPRRLAHRLRQAPAAELRRRRLAGRGLRQRHEGHRTPGRLRPVQRRHHRRAQARPHPGADRRRVRPDGRRGRREPAARQAAPGPQRHLVHPVLRHLADGVAGAGRRRPRRHPQAHARCRRRHPDRRAAGRARRTAGHRHGLRPRPQGRHRHRPQRQPAHPAHPGRAPVVARRPVPVRPEGQRRRRSRGQLLRHALHRRGEGERRPAHRPQRHARVHDGHPRPGLLARRAAHRAQRRGPRPRSAGAQAARLQRRAQAHQGRTGPLVLLGRPARAAGVAGHAGDDGRGEPGRGRPRRVRARAEGDDRRALQQPVRRHVGHLQRGLGPVRRGPHRRSGEGLGRDPARQRHVRPQPGSGRRNRRHHGRARLPEPGPAAPPGRRTRPGQRRVRRPRPRRARARLVRAAVVRRRRPRHLHRRLPGQARRGARPGLQGRQRRRLHADLGRRGRAERPADLRPPRPQAGPRAPVGRPPGADPRRVPGGPGRLPRRRTPPPIPRTTMSARPGGLPV
jgi:hypothetical protein